MIRQFKWFRSVRLSPRPEVRPEGSPKPQTQISSLLLAVGVVIAALVVYIPTVAPTISWRNGGTDSGDLAAAVATLGIPHPPGYPTYVLLGRAWTALPLGGDLAYQLNLFSATGAALAAGLSVFTIGLLGPRLALAGLPLAVGAVFGGVTLALAPVIWSQATIAEIYAPGLAILSLFSLCLLWWYYHDQCRRRDNRIRLRSDQDRRVEDPILLCAY